MKRLIAFIGVLVVAASGCQKPGAVIVEPPPSGDVLEVTSLPLPDINPTIGSFDSLGVTTSDAANFSGFLLVNRVTYDAGAGGVSSAAYSSVYFADRTKPYSFNGRTIGFYGMDLGPTLSIQVNNRLMFRIPYRVRLPDSGQDSSFGFFYFRDLGAVQPDTLVTWSVPVPSPMSSFSAQIRMPDNIKVLSPLGGSVLSRDKSVVLRWTGKGDIAIVISVVNPVTKRTRAIMKIHPANNEGKAVIDPRILQLLPRERFFMFSFIIANRDEKKSMGQYPGRILVQAASVHNSYVEFQ